MAGDKGYLVGEDEIKRIAKAVRAVEGAVASPLGLALGAEGGDGAAVSRNIQGVKVTSGTPTGNLYPAQVAVYNAATDGHDLLGSPGDVWARGANAEALANGSFYPNAGMYGESAGKPVFEVTVGGGGGGSAGLLHFVEVSFNAGDGTGVFSGNNSFQKINFHSITGYTLDDTESIYDATNDYYVVPENGIYVCFTKARPTDSQPADVQWGHGADTVTDDSANLTWFETNVATRSGGINVRVSRFTAGDNIRMCFFGNDVADDTPMTLTSGVMAIYMLAPGASGGGGGTGTYLTIRTYTGDGTYTWNKPTNLVLVESDGQGAGGGGGGAGNSGDNSSRGGGGGAGATPIVPYVYFPGDLLSSETITITAGGAGGTVSGATGNDGSNGTDGTAFGSHFSLEGGKGGKGMFEGTTVDIVEGGASGTPAGEHGQEALRVAYDKHFGGQGGNSRFAPGGLADAVGVNGSGGGGGDAHGDFNDEGKAGGAGIITLREWCDGAPTY